MTVSQGRARDTGYDTEDRTESIIDSVDRVAYPSRSLRMPFLAGGDQFGKCCLGLPRRQCGQSTSRPYQITEREVMFPLVGDHLFENSNARFVAKLFDLLTVLCNITSFIDFLPTKRQVWSTDAVRQRIRLPIRIPAELWLCPTELLDAF